MTDHPQILIIFIAVFLFLFSSSSFRTTIATSVILMNGGTSEKDVHDILPSYNLPKGILPSGVRSYSLSENGKMELQLDQPCYVKIQDQLVYYDKVIKAKLSYGSVSNVSGIQARIFFIWVPVTGMTAVIDKDSSAPMVEFHVGALSKTLPAKQFDTIPSCMNEQGSSSEMK